MFVEKLNKKQQGIYVIEEKKIVVNRIWEGYLDHDNVNTQSIAIYTGSKLTGDRVDNYFTSTPSDMPWKTSLKIFSDKDVYVSYETPGDQVEAGDINLLQDVLTGEIVRSKDVDENLGTEIDEEVIRAKNAESVLRTNLNNEITRAKSKELELDTKKATITYVDSELLKKYDKDKVYTKEEVTQLIDDLIGSSPDTLDTLKEIADALNNDPDFASTMTTELSKKVDKIAGKGLSDENFTLIEKQKLTGIENGANKYVHPTGTNPHGTSKADVGLGSADNTADLAKPVSNATSTELAKKADKTQVLTNVPAGAKFTDTVYTHPTGAGSNHMPAGGAVGQILKNTASGVATWQADNDTITTVNGKTGAITKEDITILGIPAQDTVYTHPSSHSASMIIQDSNNRFMTDTERTKLNSIATNANNYTHPSSHPASMITGLPTSLPADGGTASFLGDALIINDYNTFIPAVIAQGAITPIRAGAGANSPWSNTTSGFLIQSNVGDSFHLLIFRSGGDGWAYRSYYANKWGDWRTWTTLSDFPKKLPADGGASDTAIKLLIARKINSVDFDGTKDITITDNTKEPAFTKNTAFNKNFGTTAGTVTQGNDTRLSDARPPTSHSHSKSQITDFPASLPANGGNAATVGGFTIGMNLPAGSKLTDTIYTHPSSHPASIITGLPTKLSQFTNDTNFMKKGATWNALKGV